MKNGETTEFTTPFEVSERLHEHVKRAFDLLAVLEKQENSKELQYTLHDIKTTALLVKYYASKISGSTYVALYRETKDKQYQDSAVAQLTDALDAWKAYTETAMK